MRMKMRMRSQRMNECAETLVLIHLLIPIPIRLHRARGEDAGG